MNGLNTNTAARMPRANELAALMHPGRQSMVITAVRQETPDMKTFRFEAADGHELAYFQAGQYIPVYVEIDGNVIERAYSLTSSPEASVQGYYEICVKRTGGGYVSNYIHEHFAVGQIVELGAPAGFDHYVPLRDSERLIGIAGGSGVTPFLSMARAIADGTLPVSLTLFYGCNTADELAFSAEWATLEADTGGRFKCIPVVADPSADTAEHGFITLPLLQKYAELEGSSIFVSGPQGLMDHIRRTLAPLRLRRKFVRYCIHGDAQFTAVTGARERSFTLTVHQAGETYTVPARGDETVLRALERAGLRPPVRCRSGACGFCRACLVSGEFYVTGDNDGRRKRDKELGFIHPCCSFPESDMELIIQRG